MTAPPDSLVDGGRLDERLGDPALRVLESTGNLDPPTAPGARTTIAPGAPTGRPPTTPGAAFADLVGELSEPHPRLRFTFPGRRASPPR